jgi:dTDP-4-dehydrorhamnose reductase
MRVLITGAGGQLGRDLQAALAGHELSAVAHTDLDITDATAVRAAIDAFRPDGAVHAAALTDTTRCEREPDVAYVVNALGARNVAVACGRVGAAMVYVSTNEVFDGTRSEPYVESAEPNPLNAYARSKLAGERLVQEVLPQHYIVRTAWLYGHGGNHFVSKIVRAAESGDVTGVVDEVATPTWTRDLAVAIARLVGTGLFGIYHLTNTGEASRFAWAKEALRLAGRSNVRLRPITTAEFRASLPPDAIAPRKPPYSVLRNVAGTAIGIELRPWQDALAEYFAAS